MKFKITYRTEDFKIIKINEECDTWADLLQVVDTFESHKNVVVKVEQKSLYVNPFRKERK